MAPGRGLQQVHNAERGRVEVPIVDLERGRNQHNRADGAGGGGNDLHHVRTANRVGQQHADQADEILADCHADDGLLYHVQGAAIVARHVGGNHSTHDKAAGDQGRSGA